MFPTKIGVTRGRRSRVAYTPMVLNCQPIIPFFSRPSLTVLPRSSTVGFSMGANQKFIEAGQLTYVNTREGVTNSACCRFSQEIIPNISLRLFRETGETYLHGLPSHHTEATPTYINVSTQQVRCNFLFHIAAVQRCFIPTCGFVLMSSWFFIPAAYSIACAPGNS